MDHPPAPYEVDSPETGIPRELYDCLANCAICSILNDPLSPLQSDEVRQKAVCGRGINHHRRSVHFREALEPRHLQNLSLADVRSASPSANLGVLHDNPITTLEALHALSNARDLSKPFVPAYKYLSLNFREGRRLWL